MAGRVGHQCSCDVSSRYSQSTTRASADQSNSLIDEILKFFERQLYNTHVAAAPIAQNGAAGKPKRA